MNQILVEDIEDDVLEKLQRRATHNGRSMDDEVIEILRDAVTGEEDNRME